MATETAFTTSFTGLLNGDDDQFNMLESSSVPIRKKTILVGKTSVLYLRDQYTRYLQGDQHARYLTTNGDKITMNQEWKDLLQRLNEGGHNSQIMLVNDPNVEHNALDESLWQLKQGRQNLEMKNLLTLAAAAFGEKNFVVFNRSALEITDYRLEGNTHSFAFSPEGLMFYDIPLLLGPITVDNVLLMIQLTTTEDPSNIHCDVATPDGDRNFLRGKVIEQEIVKNNSLIFITRACIELVPENEETPDKISLKIPKHYVNEGMDDRKRCRFQLREYSRYGCDTLPIPLPPCPVAFPERLVFGIEIRMGEENGN